MAKQDVTVELFYSAAWNDHTSDVLVRNEITITRGRTDEQQSAPPTELALTFTTWEYNPENVTSSLYGLIGRNTPIRVTVGTSVRFVGEVASWTPRQSLGGPNKPPDRWVEVKAADITRRLGQGVPALPSTIFREVMDEEYDPIRVAYWPCEDEPGSSQLASAIAGADAMDIDPDDLQLASYSGFLGSKSLPSNTAAGTGPIGVARGRIPPYTGDFFYRGLFAIADDGLNDDSNLVRFYFSGGDVAVARVQYLTLSTNIGAFRLQLYDEDGNLLDQAGGVASGLDGTQFLMSIELVQDGADIDYIQFRREVGTDGTLGGTSLGSGTFTGLTLGTAKRIIIAGGPSGPGAGLSFGHQMIGTSQDLVFNISDALTGWVGEHAGTRFLRLCDENGITAAIDAGTETDTQPMGAQTSATLLDLLGEVERTDDAMVDGDRDGLGLRMVTGRARYNQAAALALDYADGEVSPPLEPVVGDQAVRNDVTASRAAGSTARAVDQDGRLGVDTIGRVATQVDVNPMSDADLAGHAKWHLHLGTIGGTRFPQITVDLDANPSLVATVDAVDVGSRITVDNLPAELTPDLASLLVIGYAEHIGSHRRTITFAARPETPFHVPEVEHDDYAIIGSDRTTLIFDFIAGTETDMFVDVSNNVDLRWDGGEVPFDILVGGVRLTVTAVAAFGSIDQEFTITQTPVNGVEKTIPAGTSVDVFHKSYIGL